MIDIKDLYTKVYGDVNPNEVQMRMFTDFLLRKLKYEDLQYISFTHVSNLLESDDFEKRIIRIMKHPALRKQIEASKDYRDEIDELFDKLKDNEYISISLIQRRCSMGFCTSQKFYNEMIRRNMIIPTNSARGYKVNKEYKK